MAKNFVITSIAIIFLSLFCGFCLAAEGDMKMNVNDFYGFLVVTCIFPEDFLFTHF